MDLINIKAGDAAAVGLLGYMVVFLGLILLMLVVMLLGKVMKDHAAKMAQAVPCEAPVEKAVKLPEADGTAGELKLYDTDPRDAAMIMAIVANRTGKPLNELRFKSIREVEKK